jgi:hypothetical protein
MLAHQFMAQKLAEPWDIPGRGRVGCHHTQDMPLRHLGDPIVQHHHGLRAKKPSGVKFIVVSGLCHNI